MKYTLEIPEEHIRNLCADYLEKMALKLRNAKKRGPKRRGRKPGKKTGNA